MNTPNSQVTEQVRVVIAEMRATGQHQEVFGDRIHEWAEDLEAALTARTEAANTIHSCSYYCDRPECIKAQRDELRESYVVRGREYPNERPQPAQGDGWLPIESAPKDGTFILVGGGQTDEDMYAREDRERYAGATLRPVAAAFIDGDWCCGYWDGGWRSAYLNPTHWRPHPPPPAPADGGTK